MPGDQADDGRVWLVGGQETSQEISQRAQTMGGSLISMTRHAVTKVGTATRASFRRGNKKKPEAHARGQRNWERESTHKAAIEP